MSKVSIGLFLSWYGGKLLTHNDNILVIAWEVT